MAIRIDAKPMNSFIQRYSPMSVADEDVMGSFYESQQSTIDEWYYSFNGRHQRISEKVDILKVLDWDRGMLQNNGSWSLPKKVE